MPVPSLVTDLSTTVASNSPAGSDNVFPDLDNYLRALSAFLASIRDNSGNGWVSPYLPLTYSAGTANAVAYLNGSKVVTTGAGLTFDGTNFATTGTASATKLIPTGGSATGNGMYLPAANTLAFSTNGAEVARLDSSGNLGIGTATPSSRLDVTSTTNAQGVLIRGRASDNIGTVEWFNNAGTTRQGLIQGTASGFSLYADTGASNVLAFFTSASERARIDSSGNLLVGTGLASGSGIVAGGGKGIFCASSDNGTIGSITTDNAGLTNLTSYRATGGVITFVTANTGGSNTERARITSGGDLLVGTTSAAGAGGITLFNNVGPGFSLINNNNAGATGYVFSSFRRSSVEIGSVTQNGTTAVLFNTTSDRRLKENIAPAPSASDVIDAIQIVSHDWKSAPDEHVTYGVIAQDLALVAPQAVLQGDDGDEIEKTWGVDYSKLVPMLVKEIQSLRARVAALEA